MRLALCTCVALLTGCGVPPPRTVGDTSSDLPLTGLDESWQRAFDEGDRLFDVPFRAADGLGPLYIRQSCSGCHQGAARGPGTVKRMVQLEPDGSATPGQPELRFGSVERPFSTSGATPLLAPSSANIHVSTRSGIPVMGRGWLEAIADSELERVATEQSQRTDGISGRINHVRFISEANPDTPFHHFQKGDLVIGRFGLKARQPTLDDFAADALQGDMGLTSPMRPNEVANQEGITDDGKPGVDVDGEMMNALGNYVRLIAIPVRKEASVKGRDAFATAGCATCHVPSLRTRADYPIPQLADADAPVFSDLLLHDLGPAFSDGLTDGEAGPSEWRTAPLIGVRFLTAFLHDGRTDDLRTAIELHGGEGSEAKASIDSFRALPADDQAALLDFVSSL
ncbi:MAG: di-heme oxidoredictase family protein [Archangium sp.]